MVNIKEELNRIKFLYQYKKGKIISEQKVILNEDPPVKGQTQSKVPNKTVQNPDDGNKPKINAKYTVPSSTVISQEPTVKFSPNYAKVKTHSQATYTVGDDSPTTFLNKVYESVITKLLQDDANNKVGDKAKTVVSGVTITYIKIKGTASNQYGKNSITIGTDKMPTGWTCFDLGNDFKTKAPALVESAKSTDPGYKSNVTLSKNRADKFWISFQNKLKNEKRLKVDVQPGLIPVIENFVIDTGGMIDESRDDSVYKNPGQTVSLDINFTYGKVTTKYNPNPVPGWANEASTSTYWCDSSDGTGKVNEEAKKLISPNCMFNTRFFQVPSNPTGQLWGLNKGQGRKDENQIKAEFNPNGVEGLNNLLKLYGNERKYGKNFEGTTVDLGYFSTQYDLFQKESKGTWKYFWNNGKIVQISKNVTADFVETRPDGSKVVLVKKETKDNILGDPALMDEFKGAINFCPANKEGTGFDFTKCHKNAVDSYLKMYF